MRQQSISNTECQEYLVKFDISDIMQYTKSQWKNTVKKNIKNLNKDTLIHTMKSYTKLDHKKFMTEEFQLQSYMTGLNIEQARHKFRIRSFMTKTVKMNFPNDIKYKKQLWKCQHCPNIDTQSHKVSCPAYQHLRLHKNLDNDQDLVSFFQGVILIREKEDSV